MERIPRWPWPAALAVAVLCASMLGAGWQPARAAPATDVLPDLVADPPDHPSLNEYVQSGGSRDLLLRFDGSVHNAGAGAFELRGARASKDQSMPPLQRVYRTDGSSHDDAMPNAQLFYSDADGHHHWHLQNVARYSLWSEDRTAEVAPSLKVGFCLGDVAPVEAPSGSKPYYDDPHGKNFCQKNQPDALSLFEGVSAGWRDVYDHTLALQWVVVSDVLPGTYRLREDVDPNGIVHESNETNGPGWAASPVTVPGYVARGFMAPASPYGQSQRVTLGADGFGSPGDPRFRIVAAPAHGSLNVAAGSAFTDPTLTYTPAKGYSGQDSFTYQAFDSTSSYPIHPGTATVALTVGAPPVPSVAIDSAPASVEVGHGVQLHATVANDLPGVTWSVEGVDGGSPATGTVTSGGFYTAPASVPVAGQVTIAARSSSGAHDQRVVRITWPAPPPGLAPGTGGSRYLGGSLLSSIATAFQADLLAASVTPRRAGVVSIRARVGKHRLGSCEAKTPRGRRFTCSLRVPHGLKLGKLKIVARLVRGSTVLATVHRTGAP